MTSPLPLALAQLSRIPPERSELVKLKVKALRRGLWFRVLNRVERGLIDLAVKVVERVRSLVLARSLIGIVEKLLEAMESEVTRLIRTVGLPLAQKLGEIAQGWGNKSARFWATDFDFVQYLAVTQKNLSPASKV